MKIHLRTRTHTVRHSTETVLSVAYEEYGTETEWGRIVDGNRGRNVRSALGLSETFPQNVEYLHVGWRLVVPKALTTPSADGLTVTAGPHDTLRGIAARALGDELRWVELANRNPHISTDELRPGTEICLPPGEEEARMYGYFRIERDLSARQCSALLWGTAEKVEALVALNLGIRHPDGAAPRWDLIRKTGGGAQDTDFWGLGTTLRAGLVVAVPARGLSPQASEAVFYSLRNPEPARISRTASVAALVRTGFPRANQLRSATGDTAPALASEGDKSGSRAGTTEETGAQPCGNDDTALKAAPKRLPARVDIARYLPKPRVSAPRTKDAQTPNNSPGGDTLQAAPPGAARKSGQETVEAAAPKRVPSLSLPRRVRPNSVERPRMLTGYSLARYISTHLQNRLPDSDARLVAAHTGEATVTLYFDCDLEGYLALVEASRDVSDECGSELHARSAPDGYVEVTAARVPETAVCDRTPDVWTLLPLAADGGAEDVWYLNLHASRGLLLASNGGTAATLAVGIATRAASKLGEGLRILTVARPDSVPEAFAGLPQQLMTPVSPRDSEGVRRALTEVAADVNRRAEALASGGKPSGYPTLVLLGDVDGWAASQYSRMLCSEGPRCGVYTLAWSCRPEGVTDSLLRRYETRLAFGLDDSESARIAGAGRQSFSAVLRIGELGPRCATPIRFYNSSHELSATCREISETLRVGAMHVESEAPEQPADHADEPVSEPHATLDAIEERATGSGVGDPGPEDVAEAEDEPISMWANAEQADAVPEDDQPAASAELEPVRQETHQPVVVSVFGPHPVTLREGDSRIPVSLQAGQLSRLAMLSMSKGLSIPVDELTRNAGISAATLRSMKSKVNASIIRGGADVLISESSGNRTSCLALNPELVHSEWAEYEDLIERATAELDTRHRACLLMGALELSKSGLGELGEWLDDYRGFGPPPRQLFEARERDARVRLAGCLEELGKHADAARTWLELVRRCPEDEEAAVAAVEAAGAARDLHLLREIHDECVRARSEEEEPESALLEEALTRVRESCRVQLREVG